MDWSDVNWEEVLNRLPGYSPYDNCDGYYFDPESAINAIEFFNTFVTHTKGAMARKPYILEPHEECIAANMFGWKSEKTDLRRFREVFYFVPRKNSKTTFAAGIALYVLFTDGEIGAENYCAARDREQAKLLFEQVETMVRNRPELEKLAVLHKTTKTIHYREDEAYFKAISSEAGSKHGFNSHFVVVDELHAQKDSELVDVLETSTGARLQPLMMYITTSDFEREGSVCNDKHNYASNVRDNNVNDPSYLPCIYEATIEDDWHSEEVWYKANPNLGKSITLEYFRRMHQKAIDMPSFENEFKRLHLNIRTEQAVRWVPVQLWVDCEADYVEEDLLGQDCYMGIDISSKDDLTSVGLFFPAHGDRKHRILSYNWIPGETAILREKQDKVPYTQWIADKKRPYQLTKTAGNAIDQDRIRDTIITLNNKFNIVSGGYDPHNAVHLGGQLLEYGLNMFEFRQFTSNVSPPTAEFEKMIRNIEIEQDGSLLLKSCFGNIAAESDGNSVKLVKKKSKRKIDPIIAIIMAIGLWLSDDRPVTSNYSERGIMFI